MELAELAEWVIVLALSIPFVAIPAALVLLRARRLWRYRTWVPTTGTVTHLRTHESGGRDGTGPKRPW